MQTQAYDRAFTVYQETLTIRRATLGNDHPGVATTALGLASVLRLQEKYAASERVYKEGLAIYLNAYGELLLARQAPAEAEGLLRESLEIRQNGESRYRLGTP